MKESLLAQKRATDAAIQAAKAKFEAAIENDLRKLHVEFGFGSTADLIAALTKLARSPAAPKVAPSKAPVVKTKPAAKVETAKPAVSPAKPTGRKKRKMITPEMRARAEKLLADKVPYGKIAAELGISEQSVYNIRVASRAAAKKAPKPAAAKTAAKKASNKAPKKGAKKPAAKKSTAKKGAAKPEPAKPATEKSGA